MHCRVVNGFISACKQPTYTVKNIRGNKTKGPGVDNQTRAFPGSDLSLTNNSHKERREM